MKSKKKKHEINKKLNNKEKSMSRYRPLLPSAPLSQLLETRTQSCGQVMCQQPTHGSEHGQAEPK